MADVLTEDRNKSTGAHSSIRMTPPERCLRPRHRRTWRSFCMRFRRPPLRRVRDAHAGGAADWHHCRFRRQPVVLRERRQSDRPDHAVRHHRWVPGAFRRRSQWHHAGAGNLRYD